MKLLSPQASDEKSGKGPAEPVEAAEDAKKNKETPDQPFVGMTKNASERSEDESARESSHQQVQAPS